MLEWHSDVSGMGESVTEASLDPFEGLFEPVGGEKNGSSPDGSGDDAAVFLQELTDFFLALRGTGLMLSPKDMLLASEWLEAGWPLNRVLKGVHRGAERLTARKQPVRSLRSLRRYVEKEVAPEPRKRTSRKKGTLPPLPPLASDVPTVSQEAFLTLLQTEMQGLESLLESLAPFPTLVKPLHATLQALQAQAARSSLEPDPGERILALLSIGKDLYTALWRGLPEVDREEIRAEARAASQAALPEADSAESSTASDEPEALDELLLLLLRTRFGVLEPARLFALWDEE